MYKNSHVKYLFLESYNSLQKLKGFENNSRYTYASLKIFLDYLYQNFLKPKCKITKDLLVEDLKILDTNEYQRFFTFMLNASHGEDLTQPSSLTPIELEQVKKVYKAIYKYAVENKILDE